MDSVSRIGKMILKNRIHDHKKCKNYCAHPFTVDWNTKPWLLFVSIKHSNNFTNARVLFWNEMKKKNESVEYWTGSSLNVQKKSIVADTIEYQCQSL